MPLVSDSHLLVASPCSWFDSGYMYGVSLRGYGEFHIFLHVRELGSRGHVLVVSVNRDRSSQCKLCSRQRRSHRYSSWLGCRRACCCAATGAVVQTVQNSVEIPQLQFGEQVADVPVMLVRSCGSSTRSFLSDWGFRPFYGPFSHSVLLDVECRVAGTPGACSQVFCHPN